MRALIILFCGLICLLSQQHARAAPQVATDALSAAEKLYDEQRFRAALAVLDQMPAATSDVVNTKVLALRGKIAFNSGDYADAADLLNRSLRALWKGAPLADVELADAARAALYLSRAYAQLDRRADAVKVIQETYTRYQNAHWRKRSQQFELLLQLAVLHGDLPDAALDAECNKLAADLQNLGLDQHDRSEYLQCSLLRARYEVQQQRDPKAIELLTALLDSQQLQLASFERARVKTAIADIFRASGDSQELAWLTAALDDQQAFAGQAKSVAAVYHRAELECRLGDLQRAKDRAAARQSYLQAHDDCLESLTRHASKDANEVDPISNLAICEKLADVARRLANFDGNDLQIQSEVIERNQQLLARYGESLLPNDPKPKRLAVTLAKLYIDRGQHVAAAPLIDPQFWRDYRPLDRPMLVRTLILASDVALADSGRVSEADKLLVEAEQHCQADPNGSARIKINRARIKAESGQALVAQKALLDIIQLPGFDQLDVEVRCLARLHLGLIHKEQLNFAGALGECEAAKDLMLHELGPNHANLLPFYAAVIEIRLGQLQQKSSQPAACRRT